MASTFFGLNIGTSGLYTYQAALNTTAHNAANAETKGYTRQVLNTTAAKPISIGSSYGMVGAGVTGVSITQVRDSYYDTKFRQNMSTYGEYDKKLYYMQQVENCFNELEDNGLVKAISNFSGALQDLSTDPSSTASRTSVIQYASSLTSYTNSLAKNLQSIQQEANTEIRTSADRINALSQQIASVTKQINALEVGGGVANDLRDARNLLIDELSSYANITVTENIVTNGTGMTSYIVKLDDKILINTTDFLTLTCVPRDYKVNETDVDGLYDLYWSDGEAFNNESLSLTGTLAGLYATRDGNNGVNFQGDVASQEVVDGKKYVTLKNTNCNNELQLNIPQSGRIQLGVYEVEYDSVSIEQDADGSYVYKFGLKEEPLAADRDYTGKKASIGNELEYKGVPYYMAKLNEFVRTFAKSINDIHKKGTNLKGETGVDFFTARDLVTGEDKKLYGTGETMNETNSYFQMNCLNFSVSSKVKDQPDAIATAYSTTNGVEETDLLKDLLAKVNDQGMFNQGTPTSFIEAMVADIGIYTKEAETASKSQKNIVDAIEIQRMSISGVDTDEEAMNLVRFQNAYNLSAKVIQIMDEIYDKLINYTGA